MKVSLWRHHLSYYERPYWALFLSVASSATQSLLLFAVAMLVRHAFDVAIPRGDSELLLLIGGALILLYAVNSVIMVVAQYFIIAQIKKAIFRLREELLEKIYALPRSYYGQADLGKLQDRIVQDTERLNNMTYWLIVQFVPALSTCIVLGIVLAVLSLPLLLLLLAIGPVFVLLNRYFYARFKQSVQTHNLSFEHFGKGVLFVLQMLDLTRAQAAERFELDRQKKSLARLREDSTRVSWLHGSYISVARSLMACMAVIILLAGGSSVALGQTTLGELFSFFAVVAMLRDYLGNLTVAIPGIMAGRQSLEAVSEILHVAADPEYTGTKQISFTGKITLDAVVFGYGHEPVLRGVSLTVRPGEKVAVTGPNGAGKSTLGNLILGFYRPWEGMLRAGDVPYADLDMPGLRRQIGVVMQDPIILPGTIAENIGYGSPEASRGQIVRAAELATAHEFISRLPDGYNTYVGEAGMLLSGGQRQRIAIARALLRHPVLLILDEPTNHLDRETVRLFLLNLGKMSPRPAVLLISHDAEVVAEADRVYSLQDCIVVETGAALSLTGEAVLRRAPGGGERLP